MFSIQMYTIRIFRTEVYQMWLIIPTDLLIATKRDFRIITI